MADIMELQAKIHTTAVEHGWWEHDRNFGELIALMHSELSEALEAWREDGANPPFYVAESGKPEGWGVELVDCVIRILDALAAKKVDTEAVLLAKVAYNDTRPWRHGNKRA